MKRTVSGSAGWGVGDGLTGATVEGWFGGDGVASLARRDGVAVHADRVISTATTPMRVRAVGMGRLLSAG
jgi:hypothetical protein